MTKGVEGGSGPGLAGPVSHQDIVVGPADPARFVASDHLAWFDEVPSATLEVELRGLPDDQLFAADLPGSDPETYPGIYGVFPMTLAVPGAEGTTRQVPCAGLTWVGVHPDHRRKGLLTAMMRHHFEKVHEEPGTFVSGCTRASRRSTAVTATASPRSSWR